MRKRSRITGVVLLALLCGCAPAGSPGSVPGLEPTVSQADTSASQGPSRSEQELDQMQPDSQYDQLSEPKPEHFGLTGLYAEIFDAVMAQDTYSWSLTIPHIRVRGTKELSETQASYFISVQTDHYDTQSKEIVNIGAYTYWAVVTVSTEDGESFSWSSFDPVDGQTPAASLREIGLNDQAEQMERGEILPVLWEMPDAKELLAQYCSANSITLTSQKYPSIIADSRCDH